MDPSHQGVLVYSVTPLSFSLLKGRERTRLKILYMSFTCKLQSVHKPVSRGPPVVFSLWKPIRCSKPENTRLSCSNLILSGKVLGYSLVSGQSPTGLVFTKSFKICVTLNLPGRVYLITSPKQKR